jgi:DNA-binding NarL/FixJ family response regulator
MRVVVAEDHALVRTGIRLFLANQKGLEVVAETDRGYATEQLVEDLTPDLLILDLALPDCSGIEVATRLRRVFKSLKIVILTGNLHEASVARAFRAGVNAYVVKHDDVTELLEAIRAVCRGQKYMSRSVMAALDLAPETPVCVPPQDVITPREKQVLRLISRGFNTPQIANLLQVSVLTARKHRQNLMVKLGLHNAAEITTFAIKSGLTIDPSPT